jgi:hypothetical protein
MDYIGEHRLPGQLGHFFIVLSLVASLVATFSYFKAGPFEGAFRCCLLEKNLPGLPLSPKQFL